MKNIIKRTAMLLAVAQIMSFSVFAASDTNTFALDASATSVNSGETVEIEISISNNSGIAGLVLDLAYDTDAFTFDENASSAGSVIKNGSAQYVVNPDQNGQIRIATMSSENFTGNGSLFSLEFEAVAAGTYSFELTVQEIISENLNDLDYNSDDTTVSVKVSGSAVESTTPAPLPPEVTETPEIPPALSLSFSDVPETHWAYSYIQNVVKQGLFTGISNTQFGPDMNVTRGMFVTVLYSHAGAPAADPSTFSDVSASAWYAKSVSWASKQGIVSGIGDNKFGPELSITREQLALILYQYAKGTSPGTEAYVRMFYPDGKDIHNWALTAMSWAVNEGLISGKTGNRLAPQDTATRAEVAVIMQNFVNLTK